MRKLDSKGLACPDSTPSPWGSCHLNPSPLLPQTSLPATSPQLNKHFLKCVKLTDDFVGMIF